MPYTPTQFQDPAAGLNAEFQAIADDLASLHAASGAAEAWSVPTLANGWVNYGAPYRDAGYRKEASGLVRLRGLIKSGTVGGAAGVAFVLPTGYRPVGNILFIALSNAALGRVDIESDGTVRIQPPSVNNWIGLDHIAFPAGA